MDNQKQPVQPDEMCFNDCDKAVDVLSCLKTLAGTYCTFATEAGSQQLHEKAKVLLNETFATQRALFEILYTKGWYKVTAEDTQKLQQNYTQNAQMATQLKK